MITIGDIQLSYLDTGLFETDLDWIHPTLTASSYELLYVVEGEIHIREGEQTYDLQKGEMLLLEPGIEYGGTRQSLGRTCFYWLRFHCSDLAAISLPKRCKPNESVAMHSLAELMYLQRSSPVVAELAFARFLLECGKTSERGDRRVAEICEYMRANSGRSISVTQVAEHFGYSADHLSRLLKKELGVDAKTAIVRYRMEYVESKLLHSDYSIKEIAAQCGFEDENTFVKFFKYHARTTPSLLRSKHFRAYNDK